MQAENHGLVSRFSIQHLYIRLADESRIACTVPSWLTLPAVFFSLQYSKESFDVFYYLNINFAK